MQTHVYAVFSLMTCVSFTMGFHHTGSLTYHVGNFDLRSVSSLSSTKFQGLSRCLDKRSPITTAMSMIGHDHSSSSHNHILVRLLGLVSFAVLSGETMVQAFVPDLSESPLKNAPPTIIVEGVPRIVDGDTLVIETNGVKERIRLLGIDAPESKQMCNDKSGSPYACGLEAKQSLEKIIGRDPVQCLAAKRDQYSRILGVCFDAKTGQDLNKELVVEGEAIAYTQYSKAYVTTEEAAKKQGRGVWRGNFEKPWEYRKQQRAALTAGGPQALIVKPNPSK